MKLTATLLLLPTLSWAEVVYTPHDGNPFGSITVINREETGHTFREEVVETPYGVVVLEYHSTPNYPSMTPDRVVVISLPDGVVASLEEFELDENAKVDIELFFWEGM
jgi:hypothetical protein